LLQYQTETEQYWTENFHITDEDIEYIFSVFLEDEKPLSSQEIAHRLIKHRIDQETQMLRRQIERGEIFQPQNTYSIGQNLVFPALNYNAGEIIGLRPGNNPDYGDFTVIQVDFGGGKTREFAAELKAPHALNLETGTSLQNATNQTATIDTVLRDYGDDIVYMVEDRLHEEKDIVHFGGRWFLRSLLADVEIAHLHLAEAALFMYEGGPLDTSTILKEIDLPREVNPRLQAFSLDYALFHDDRFDEIGPAGKVLWFLKELEPEEVNVVPERLKYEPIDYNWRLLSDELTAL
jgi:hypothetical protein